MYITKYARSDMVGDGFLSVDLKKFMQIVYMICLIVWMPFPVNRS